MRFTSPIIVSALAVGFAGPACETYNPPPEATLFQPQLGYWTSETPIVIDFSEPIDPTTLVVTIWPGDKDIEGNFRPDVKPLVEHCSLATSPCSGMTLTLDADATQATILQNDVFADKVGTPLVLRVEKGLADPLGRTRDVDTDFDFQINPLCGNEPISIDLQTGVITMVANLQVLPIWLHMYLDLAVDPHTGKVLVVGTFARVDKDHVPTLPTNYPYPDGHLPELSSTGWAVTFNGCLIDQHDGTFFFQSEPFDVHITVLNTIPVTLSGFQVQGTIVPGGGTTADCADFPGACEGHDKGSGTLSTSGGEFGDPPTTVDPITTAWSGYGVTQAELDEYPGLPRACADDPCAEMRANGGDCQLPDPWDPGAACE
ncbi:MAG: hypothetical protein U1F43_38955 [Myxococcota bacterium]